MIGRTVHTTTVQQPEQQSVTHFTFAHTHMHIAHIFVRAKHTLRRESARSRWLSASFAVGNLSDRSWWPTVWCGALQLRCVPNLGPLKWCWRAHEKSQSARCFSWYVVIGVLAKYECGCWTSAVFSDLCASHPAEPVVFLFSCCWFRGDILIFASARIRF